MKHLGWTLAVSLSAGVALAWTDTGGGDHLNQDWAPANGIQIAGYHYNVKQFSIPVGSTIWVAPGTGGFGSLTIDADAGITIAGSLMANYRGRAGGTGAAGSTTQGAGGSGAAGSGGGLQGAAGAAGSQSGGGGGGGAGNGNDGGTGGLGGQSNSGATCNASVSYGGDGGLPIGNDSDDEVSMGAGGGGGGAGGGASGAMCVGSATAGATGTPGGGEIRLLSPRGSIVVTGIVQSYGGQGGGGSAGRGYAACTGCVQGGGGGGGGGGAGGGILLKAKQVSFTSGSLGARGGSGGPGGNGGQGANHAGAPGSGGGGGSGGRVKVRATIPPSGSPTVDVSGGMGGFPGTSTITCTSGVCGAVPGTWGAAGGAGTYSVGRCDVCPNRLVFTQQPANLAAGGMFTPAIKVAVQNDFGTTFDDWTGSVTLAVVGGTATLLNAPPTALVAGVATFSTASMQTAGTYQLVATSPNLASATSNPFAVAPGSATHIEFSPGVTQTAAGDPLHWALFSFRPAVVFHDPYHNVDTNYPTRLVTVTLNGGPGDAVLAGTTARWSDTVGATAGRATFTDLWINRAATGYTLTAVASGTPFPSANSFAFDIVPANADHIDALDVTGSPPAGTPFNVAVNVLDPWGNATGTGYSANVSLSVVPSVSLVGYSPQPAAPTGTATFNGLSIAQTGSYTITGSLLLSGGATKTDTTLPFSIVGGPAASAVVTAPPASVIAGVPFDLTVTVKDSNLNGTGTGYTSVTLAVSSPGVGLLGQSSKPSTANGVYDFAGLQVTQAGGPYQISVGLPGSGVTTTTTAFSVVPAAASSVTITTPGNTAAGAAFGVTATALDAYLNPTGTGYNAIDLSLLPSGALNGTTLQGAPVNGVASFSGLSIATAGAYQVQAALVGTGFTATSGTFNIDPGAAEGVTVTTPTATSADSTFSVTVSVSDGLGNLTGSGYTSVSLSVESPGVSLGGTTSRVASPTGILVFPGLAITAAGSHKVRATLLPVAAPAVTAVTNDFAILPGVAASLSATQPPGVKAGEKFSTTITVKDQHGNDTGNGYSSLTLDLAASGTPLLGTTSLPAPGSGVASTTDLEVRVTGSYTLRAALVPPGGVQPFLSAPFLVSGAVASGISIATTATLVPSTGDFGVTVQVRDGFGNLTRDGYTADVTLALQGPPPGVFLSGATTRSALPGGEAIFSGLSIHRVGTYAVVATLPRISGPALSVPSGTITISPGAADHLAFGTQPQSAIADQDLPAFRVDVQDLYDNTATGYAGDVTVAMDPAFAGVILAGIGPKTVASVQGEAGFSNLAIRTPGTGYRLKATSGTFSIVSAPFDVAAGPATHLLFLTQPSNGTAGAALAPFQVGLRDAYENPATAHAAAVTVTASKGAQVYGTPSVLPSQGAAQFTDVSLRAAGTAYVLTASTPGGAGSLTVQSGAFDVVAAPPAALFFSTAAQTVTAGDCSGVVGLVFEDAYQNAAAAPPGTLFQLSGSTPTAQFFADTDATCAFALPSSQFVLGVAKSLVGFRFMDSRTGTLDFTAAGMLPAQAGTIPAKGQQATVLPGAPIALVFTTPPQSVVAGVCSSPVEVAVEDRLQNPSVVPVDVTVLLEDEPGGPYVFADDLCAQPASAQTIATGGGKATFYFRALVPGAVTLTATTPLLQPPLAQAVQQVSVLAPAPATKLAFLVLDPSWEAEACASTRVEVEDATSKPSPVLAATDVLLATSTLSGAFFKDASCANQVTRMTLSPGEYQARAFYRDPVVGPARLTASAAALATATLDVSLVCPKARDGTACPDQNLCNGAETCRGGSCATGVPPSCDDLDPCTVDSCDPLRDCQHAVVAACCRTPSIDGNVSPSAAVGVPYRLNASGKVGLLKGTGPIAFSACGTPPAGLGVDSVTGLLRWTPAASGPHELCVAAQGPCGRDELAFVVQVSAVPPAPPSLVAQVTPPKAAVGQAVAGTSAGTTGTLPLLFAWDFGDGSPGVYGPAAPHKYLRAGGFTVRVRVWDGAGQEASVALPMTVTDGACPAPPRVKIVPDGWVSQSSLAAQFSCDCQVADPGAIFAWDFGDGTTERGREVQHTYAPGSYLARLVVTDAAGCQGMDQVPVRVSAPGNLPPECGLTALPTAGPAPLKVRYEAVFGDPDGVVTNAQLSFTDGVSADLREANGVVERTFESPGQVKASFVAIDDKGLACRASLGVQATGASGLIPPRILSEPPLTAECGVAYVYGGDGRARAEGTWPFTWSVGKGGKEVGRPPGMAIDPLNGTVTWVPEAKAGPQRVTIVAENAAGVDEQDFTVDVTCAESKPAGCHCQATSGAVALWGLGLLALMGVRRRR